MINSFVWLTQATTPIIGDIAKIFGEIMNAIYSVFSSVGIESLGISIIVFTLIVRSLMLPLAFKQQKSMKEMQKIQPELKKIQEKYKNKKDPESQQKYQMEMNKLYQEHGVNPLGGCLPMLVQLPIMFALFQVLRNLPAYIQSVKALYTPIAESVMNATGANVFFTALYEAEGNTNIKQVGDFDITVMDKVIDVISKFTTEQWAAFNEHFSALADVIVPNFEKITEIYMFFGIDLSQNPDLMSIGVLLPILNVAVQFMVSKTSMASSGAEQNQTQKSMMYTMPLITAFFVTQMPAGLGLYWLVSSLFQWVQQTVINRHLHDDENNKNKKKLTTKK